MITKSYIRGFAAFIVLVLCIKTLPAKENISFEKIELAPDFTYRKINTLCSDDKGFLWIGTDFWLGKYDGYNTHRAQEKEIFIRKLINISNKLIILTDKNILIENLADNSRTEIYKFGDEDKILDIIKDKSDVIWFMSKYELFKYNTRYNKLESYDWKISGHFSRDNIFGKLSDGGDHIYFILNNKLYSHNKSNGVQDKINLNITNQLLSLKTDESGNIIIGTPNSLLFYNTRSGNYIEKTILNDNNTVNDFIICNDNIWCATSNGLYIYNKITKNIARYTIPLSGNKITTLHQDKSGVVWLGTYNSVYSVNPHSIDFTFNTLNSKEISISGIQNISQDSYGKYWITSQNSLFSLNNNTVTKLRDFKSDDNSKINLHIDKNQNLWISASGNLYKMNNRGELITTYKLSDSYQNNSQSINCITEDDNLNIFAGSSAGLVKISENSCKTLIAPDKINRIRSIFPLNKSVLLIGTEYGLYSYNIYNKQINHFTHNPDDNQSLSANGINIIHKSKNGEIFIGTDRGLNIFNYSTKTFKRINLPELSRYSIRSVTEDNNNILWLTYQSGVLKYNIKSERLSIANFRNLPVSHFLTYSNNSTSDGLIHLIGEEGFITFNPDKIYTSENDAMAIISGFRIFNEDISKGKKFNGRKILTKNIEYTDKIELKHNENSFAFNFMSPKLQKSHNKLFAYKLNGFDNEWHHHISELNYAKYTNIPSGGYTLELKSTNYNGEWYKNVKTLKITIESPWWRGVWAYLMFFLIISLTILVIVVVIRKRIELKHKKVLEEHKAKEQQQLNRRKIEFFTNIAHELKTPLTLIKLPLEDILLNNKENKEINTKVSYAYRSTERLSTLMNQLLDIQKIENNTLSLNVIYGDIVSFTKEVVSQYIQMADSKKVSISFKPLVEAHNIWFDRDKLSKIFSNLITNAIKYNNQNGNVYVSLSIEDNLKIMVEDNGIGIDNDNLEKIFKPYFQEKKNISGTGIGLSYAKNLAELHKGFIDAKSEKGKGSLFTLNLPLEDLYSDDEKSLNSEVKNTTPVTPTLSNDAGYEQVHGEIKLLIVDDEPEIRQYLTDYFKDKYECIYAENGKQALKMVTEHHPSLVISDIMMPVMDGNEFCEKLKSDINISHIPVILLTALSGEENIIKGLKTGADCYIEKPFNLAVLENQINSILSNRATMRNKYLKEMSIGEKDITYSLADENLLENLAVKMNEYLTDPELTVEALAAELNMSRSVLYRKVKAITGLSVSEYINAFRLKKAMQLLQNTNLPVAEIATQTGYSDPRYFSRVFKKQYGNPPSKYQMKGNNS